MKPWDSKPGDEKIMKVPLDWVGVHYYLRLIASDSSNGAPPDLSSHDPYAQIRIELADDGPKTDGGRRCGRMASMT